MQCTACKRDQKIIAKGLCSACYQRQWKTGSTDYQRKGRVTPCQVNGCGGRAISKGYCDKHRRRLERHGTLELKSDCWGARSNHPLKYAWQHLRRYRAKDRVCEAWQDDFLQFINDVGERPSAKHKLFAADDSRPIGPDNFVWKKSVTERVPGEDEATYRRRRQRVYRALRTEEFKGYDLKKMYGLSLEQFEAMHREQGGKCAICKKPETVKNPTTQEPRALAVDHCHTTGKVRALLCTNCNKMIGHAGDSVDILRAAVAYLDDHGIKIEA